MTPQSLVHRIAIRRVLPVLIPVLAVACASMSGHEPLEVTLSNLEVGEVTVFETTVEARLRITNPNPEPLSVNGASFTLTLDDRKIGTGTAPEAFTVDRLDSTVIRATFNINNAAAVLQLRDILDRQTVRYAVRGSLFTDGAFGTRRVRVEKSGTLDLAERGADLSP